MMDITIDLLNTVPVKFVEVETTWPGTNQVTVTASDVEDFTKVGQGLRLGLAEILRILYRIQESGWSPGHHNHISYDPCRMTLVVHTHR